MSPRTAEANEAIHEERRTAILNAALGAFVERGFEGTRIQEIADRCGLSYGLVYHYFPAKEAVFAVLVDAALAAAGSLVRALPPGSPPEAFGGFVAYAIRDPSPQYFSIIVEALTKQGVAPELAARAREAVQGIKAALAAAAGSAAVGGAGSMAEAVLALLLGASIMKSCGVSDGDFASRAATILADSAGE